MSRFTTTKKLDKIKKSALFLGDMSIMHEQALKSTDLKTRELKDDLKFFEEMILKERVARKNVKEAISKESSEYELLFQQAK